MISPYPEAASERDRWIIARRPPRPSRDPSRPHDFWIEEERADSGEIIPVATLFLVNRECPWRCLVCDLWKNTLEVETPPGAIPAQIGHALRRLPPARQIKLYNSGSFFDPRAIPIGDHAAIARAVTPFDRVIVECHPALIDERVLRFRDMLSGRLEVALGLETAHPEVLAKLNKRMTLSQFAAASDFLRRHGIALRVFALVKPPFMTETEALEWACRSVEFAFDCGATVVSLIPTRLGNGALETLRALGQFALPRLATLEAAVAFGLQLRRGRVFADLWDLEKFSDCGHCFQARQNRLVQMNRTQIVPEGIRCPHCARDPM